MSDPDPDPIPGPGPDPDYVTVRRPADVPFKVLPDDLVAGEPHGYDLSLVRSVASEGLTTPITVQPVADGKFRVVDGQKRLDAIRLLVRTNKMVYDALRGVLRPARRVFALVRCRLKRPPAGRSGRPADAPDRDPR